MARTRPAEIEEQPESDRLEGFPHPRETRALIGQGAAERAFLDAWRGGRLHHAWLIAGPEGIGKATLAYRIARFVLAHPDPDAPAARAAGGLDVDPDDPAARRIAARSHPDLIVVRRGWNAARKTFHSSLAVDEVRRAGRFFALTSGQGGWRVAIIDSVDEMNPNAANALLKTLEEPPARALILIVSHAPGRLLATIRSRCRRLALAPLAPDDLLAAVAGAGGGEALAALAGTERERLVRLARGSVRRALQLLAGDGLALHAQIAAVLAAPPGSAERDIHALAERLARRGGEAEFDFAIAAIGDLIAERIEAGAGRLSGASLARLAEVWEKISRLAAETATFHYDRRQVILTAFHSVAAATS